MRAIREHGRWVAVIVSMAAVALVVTGYLLVNQRVSFPSWVPGVGQADVRYRVVLDTAQSVTPGQGQTVTIAGVEVGDITDVQLRDGRAVVGIRIREKYAPMMRRDASALLRPKTGLNDMVLELDPGTPRAPRVDEGFTIAAARTRPNVNIDEILASLDADTRGALQLLLQGAGSGLEGEAPRLSAGLRQIDPVTRNLRRIGEALEDRRANTRRVVNRLRRVTEALAESRGDVVRAVDTTDTVFSTIGARDRELRSALRDLPATLRATRSALDAGGALADQLRPATEALLPVAAALEPAMQAARPLLRETEPVLRRQLLPFSRETLPTVRRLRRAAQTTAELSPDATATLETLNRAANLLAYDPPGEEQGYLFWTQWLMHLAPWIFNTQDAHGPIRRGILLLTCTSLGSFSDVAKVNPVAGLINGLFAGLSGSGLCPIGPGDSSGSSADTPRGTARGTAGSAPRRDADAAQDDRDRAAAAAAATTGGDR